jgi:hypothetical protein
MPTKLDLKTSVARQLGKTNASTPTPKRDLSINDALMQYTNERAWVWNQATTSLSDGGTLPNNFSSDSNPIAYYYDSGRKVDVQQVANADLANFTNPVFSVDSGTFETNVTVPVSIIYQMTPASLASTGSDDASVLPMKDISTVSKLAVALYWLAAERDEDNFDRFMRIYDTRLLPRDILKDQQRVTASRAGNRRRAMGWNVNNSVTNVSNW